MAEIKFSSEERGLILQKIQRYFSDELDQELGHFDAGFLLDFFEKELGPTFYNRGLYDAQAMLQKQIDSIIEAIYGLEKPTKLDRA